MFLKLLAWVTYATCLSIDGTEFGSFIEESFELNLNDIKDFNNLCIIKITNNTSVIDIFAVTDNSTINFINNENAKNCISLPNQNQGDSILIQVTGLDTGSVMFRFESGGEKTPDLTIRILKSKNIYYLDQSIGWLYFVLWSVSFYPQVVMNFRRKSVVGFNFDYLGYDLVGFISFTLYNCLLFWSPAVFAFYQQKNPGSANPIQFNDVFFCIHAIFIQTINTYQCCTYESNNQKMSLPCRIILSLTVGALVTYSIIVGFNLVLGLNWFDVLTFASFIKVGSSVIKYMPQVYLNWKRKCTLGFAIDMAILDISGGTACYLQTIIQYVNAQDTAIITGNIGKIGIGFVSCFFDVILLVQHFCLYGKNNDNKLNEAIDEREKDKPEIAGSGWLESVKSIADSKYGFSPMASAVLYHAPKGDLMNSTASFRDVFSADLNTNQAWQEITGSRISGKPFGASVTGSRAGYMNGAPRTSVT